MTNGEIVVATHTYLLPFPQLHLATWKCDVLSALEQPLLSHGQFYDAIFKATIDSETVELTKDGIATLSGTRDHINGLYFILLQGYPTSPHYALLTTGQPEFPPITSSSHTPLQAHYF